MKSLNPPLSGTTIDAMAKLSSKIAPHRACPRQSGISLLRVAVVSALALSHGAVAGAQTSGSTWLISVQSGGELAECDDGSPCFSIRPTMSADGRLVAFASANHGLAPGGQQIPGGQQQIYLHDRHTCTTTRLSATPNGTPADGTSKHPSMSADGRFVAFSSAATNLVPQASSGDDNIFVLDRQTGAFELISVSPEGDEGNGWSLSPTISADGRYVCFASVATNLVQGDTNGAADVFVRDRQTDTMVRMSVSSAGEQANASALRPHMSANGRFVTWDTTADNLSDVAPNSLLKVFVRDRDANETGVFDQPGEVATILASVNSAGEPADDHASRAAVASNGWVAFDTEATNLVPGDTNDVFDVFVHNVVTGETQRVSETADGAQTTGSSFNARFAPGGTHVAFSSRDAATLVDNDAIPDDPQIVVHNLNTLDFFIASVSSDGEYADSQSEWASMTNNAEVIAFGSAATTLVQNPPPGDSFATWTNVYVHAQRPADFDLNNVVNVTDLLFLLGEWDAGCSVADFDGNQSVGVSDLLTLLADWGT